MSGPCTPLGSRTTTLSLCKPAAGEIGWDTSVNGNMDVIDALFFGASLLKPLNGGLGFDGSTAANGKLAIGNGAGFSLNTLTAGNSVTVTNSAGGITLDTIQDIRTSASPTFAALTVVGAKPMQQFFPPTLAMVTSTTTLPVIVRFGANNAGLSRTAGGAETLTFSYTIPLIVSTTALKGAKLTSVSIIQQITVANLTSNSTPALAVTAYVNNVANAVTAFGGSLSISMPTNTQANPYVTVGTANTPAFMTTTDAQVSIDWTTVLQLNGVYTLYGIVAHYDEAWF